MEAAEHAGSIGKSTAKHDDATRTAASHQTASTRLDDGFEGSPRARQVTKCRRAKASAGRAEREPARTRAESRRNQVQAARCQKLAATAMTPSGFEPD